MPEMGSIFGDFGETDSGEVLQGPKTAFSRRDWAMPGGNC